MLCCASLSDRQYDDYAAIAGRMTKMQLDKFVDSPQWWQIPDAATEAAMKPVFAIEHVFEAILPQLDGSIGADAERLLAENEEARA